MNHLSPYSKACVIMTTKHSKSIAVLPPFYEILGASVLEYLMDTDSLGTFSGEVDRTSSPLECARQKCEWGLNLLDTRFAIASEGSFGPHPYLPFIPCGQEILYFIDRERGFHLHMNRLCERTNYRMQAVSSFDELLRFASESQFPSHALVVRSTPWRPGHEIFKGIETVESLESAFHRARGASDDGQVWVETDMRAHFNPTRMAEISELARVLAHRLATPCPVCQSPGWGLVKTETGLNCEYRDQPTGMMAHEVFGCVLCDHTEHIQRQDGLPNASQTRFGWCNP